MFPVSFVVDSVETMKKKHAAQLLIWTDHMTYSKLYLIILNTVSLTKMMNIV